jgi:hypothetical protein
MPRPVTSERHTDVSGDDLSEEEAAAEVSREQEEQHNSDCMEEQRSPDPEPEQDEQVSVRRSTRLQKELKWTKEGEFVVNNMVCRAMMNAVLENK